MARSTRWTAVERRRLTADSRRGREERADAPIRASGRDAAAARLSSPRHENLRKEKGDNKLTLDR
jgi:hypothetical protein